MGLRKVKIEKLALLLLVAATALHQLRQYLILSAQPLWIDVINYKGIAQAMTHPYDTQVREPVLIWIIKLSLILFGNHDTSIRIMGTLFFTFTCILYYQTVKNLSRSFYIAFVALFLFANSHYVGELYMSGIRDAFFLTAVILLCFLTYADFSWLTHNRRIAGLAFTGVLAMGTRITVYPFLFLFFFMAMRRNRGNWKYLAVPAVFLVAVLGPYLVYCKQQFGDAFYAANIHAICWRNWEFNGIRGIGCPECPNPITDPGMYAGPHTTWFHYIFELHPFSELVRDSLIGLKDLVFARTELVRTMAGAYFLPLYIAYLVGLFALMISKLRWILLYPFLLTAALLFTIPLKMDPRLFTPALPFQTACTAIGCVLIAEWLLLRTKVFKSSLGLTANLRSQNV